MNKMLSICLCIGFVFFFTKSAHSAPELRKRDYRGFTLWLDCKEHHGAVAFYYETGPNKAHSRPKAKAFSFDRKVPASCQPQSWRSYRTTTVQPGDGTWSRGLLVPPRHMAHSAAARNETYTLTNTLPQSSGFKGPGGAWHRTEMITDCYGERSRLKIWGGVIWGKNADNDFFTETHGIETPDYWWKLIYRSRDQKYIAWIFPNKRSAKAVIMEQFVVTLDDLKSRVNFIPEIAALEAIGVSADASHTTWPVEQSGQQLRCDEHRAAQE